MASFVLKKTKINPSGPHAFIATVVFVLLSCFAFVPVSAQQSTLVSDQTMNSAMDLARRIEKENLTINAPSSMGDLDFSSYKDAEKLRQLRYVAMDAIVYRNNLPIPDILQLYKEEALSQNNERNIAIAEILSIYMDLQGTDTSVEPAKSRLRALQNYRSHEDWFVGQRAALMEASLPVYFDSFDISLKETNAALALIPNKLTRDVLEAQYETYEHIAYLHVVLQDIELGISTTVQVIDKAQEHNRPIDGISVINNLIYVFNGWHEYEISEQMAEILFRLSNRTSNEVNSLVYYRYGQAQNNAMHYAEALPTLNKALENTEEADLRQGIELARAVSFAGLGRADEANESLKEFDRITEETGIRKPEHSETKLQALTLLAMADAETDSATVLFDSRLKSVVQRLLDRQNKGVQSLQANLENDKNRQAERETALRRETALKQSELEAKQRSNVALMGLAGMLFLTALAAIGFALWRQKISKILEVAAHDAEAGDRAKSQFLSVMSHELRTPLNGIIGIASILSEKGETKELRNYNKLILKSGQNLLELLSGILDMSQMESGNLNIITAPSNIRQMVEGLYLDAKEKINASDVEITCFVSDDLPEEIMLDSIRVKQALSNLISNAVRFTDEGRIHIHITMGEPDRKGARDLTMIVADTGRGITEEVQQKLFKPFVQADSSLTRTHDGAGIGLAVTRGLSRLMGGDVTMTSKAGRGSEFTMVIKTCTIDDARIDPQTDRPVFEIEPSAEVKVDFAPAVSLEKLRADQAEKQRREFEEQEESEDASIDFEDVSDVEFETISDASPELDTVEMDILSDRTVEMARSADNPRAGFSRKQARSDEDHIAPDQLQGLNILIVEDVAANQEVLRSLLEPVGCDVSCAEHGQEAMDMMKTQIFDAVIMDIRMPVMNGIETTKAIRRLSGPHQNVAIIALTADASAENNAECLAAGADVFLTKPVVVSELFSSIRFARRKQFRQKQQALSA